MQGELQSSPASSACFESLESLLRVTQSPAVSLNRRMADMREIHVEIWENEWDFEVESDRGRERERAQRLPASAAGLLADGPEVEVDVERRVV